MAEALAQSAIRDPQSATGLVAASEAARAMGCSVRSIQVRCKRGELPARQVDGLWYVEPDSIPELRLLRNDTPLAIIKTSPLAGLTAAKREVIQRRYAAVTAYEAARAHKPADMPLAAWEQTYIIGYNAHHPEAKITSTTLWRWRRAFESSGVAGLIDRRDYHGPASISPQALDFILGLYLSENRPHLAAIYERACAIAPAEGWQLPTLRTVQSIVSQRVDRKVLDLGRDPKRYRDRDVPMAVRDWTKIHANQLWVSDHRRLDIFVPYMRYDPKQRKNVCTWQRPWLTAFLDARTWYPIAWQIYFGDPNSQIIMQTFVQGVLLYGLPKHLYLDNGKDFRAERFAGGRKKSDGIVRTDRVEPMLELLGVGITWALPYNARAKVIENFFHIVSERFDKNWTTYCGCRHELRPEKLNDVLKLDPEPIAKEFNLQSIQTGFADWVNSDYTLREAPPESCQGYSTLRAFNELRPNDYQPIRPAPEDLSMLLLPSRPARVEANGLYVNPLGQYYYAPQLESYRCNRTKVTYRWNEHDSSKVFVFTADQDRFVCIAEPYVGNGLHPLAMVEGDDSQDRVQDVLTMQRRLGKEHRAEVRRCQAFAKNYLLTSQADAARRLGLHDVSVEVESVPPTQPPLLAGGVLRAANDAKKKHKQTQKRRAAQRSAACLDNVMDENIGKAARVNTTARRAADPLSWLSGGEADEHQDDVPKSA